MIPWFQWTTIQLGPLTLQVWGLFVALGMLLSVGIISRRAAGQGIDKNKAMDFAIWIMISGFLFARLFHVFFYEPAFFLAHPSEIIQIWHGGMSSFGGLFGGILAFYVWHTLSLRGRARAMTKQSEEGNKIASLPATAVRNDSMLAMADIISFGLVFGWIIGRVGCFMIHDHLGIHCNCPFALQTPTGPRLDMALLEIIGMMPLAILFFCYRHKNKTTGWFTSVLFIYYGVLRFILDFFRATDIAGADARYLGLTPGQFCAILMVAAGVFLFKKKASV